MSEITGETLQADDSVHTPVPGSPEAPLDKIFTVANVISFIRLCMAPVALALLLNGSDIPATILFGVAASTDFVDGQIARRTHTVTKLGKLLDPAVDRMLMICGVVGLLVVGRLPIWIVLLVVARDSLLLLGSGYLIREYNVRVDVIYPGKVATTFLFFGFAFLILNMPTVQGLGWVDWTWLPGFCAGEVGIGIWFVYIGLLIGVYTTCHYIHAGYSGMVKAKAERQS